MVHSILLSLIYWTKPAPGYDVKPLIPKNSSISARTAFSALLPSSRWPTEINRGHSTPGCNVLGDVKESIRQKQIIRVSERDQTLLASSPTHGWFTGKLIKCCSSLSEVHDSSSSSMDKLLLKPMITFLHLATKHNRMWLLVLGARMIQRENTETLQAGRQHAGKAGRERFSHTHTRGVCLSWLCWWKIGRVGAVDLQRRCQNAWAAGRAWMGMQAEPWGGWWGCSSHLNTPQTYCKYQVFPLAWKGTSNKCTHRALKKGKSK